MKKSPTSEAFAESNGTLKRSSKSLSTACCVESTILRSAGLTLTAEVERMAYWNCVGLIFWGRQELSLHDRNSKVRWRRFVMGPSSATLNRVLMDNQRNKWTERDPLKAAQVFGGGRAAFRVLVLLRQGKQHSSL